jgi:hypothetical protein
MACRGVAGTGLPADHGPGPDGDRRPPLCRGGRSGGGGADSLPDLGSRERGRDREATCRDLPSDRGRGRRQGRTSGCGMESGPRRASGDPAPRTTACTRAAPAPIWPRPCSSGCSAGDHRSEQPRRPQATPTPRRCFRRWPGVPSPGSLLDEHFEGVGRPVLARGASLLDEHPEPVKRLIPLPRQLVQRAPRLVQPAPE